MKKKAFVFITLFVCLCLQTGAKVMIPNIFSSNMVLQRNVPVPFWGWATPGENITVSFDGQIKHTVANSEGKWSLSLDPLQVLPKSMELIIEGTNSIRLNNILVGDVWICSGQSNMEYPLDRSLKKYAPPLNGIDEAIAEFSKPKSDMIRFIYAEKQYSGNDIKTDGWITTNNDSVLKSISSVGYFFSKYLCSELNVPIGIISTSWGGTRIEEWTDTKAYQNSLIFKDSVDNKNSFTIDGIVPGKKFASMILPIIPFAIKGMLWYQGESNCMIEDQSTYPEKIRLLVESYRTLFRNPNMPFYYVQLAPYVYTHRKKDKKTHTTEQLAFFREAQTQCLTIPNTGMVITTDLVDNALNIHPPYKWTVGRRLALMALNKTYGKKMICSGPTYKSIKVSHNKAILSFENIGGGLVSNDGQSLNWFSIAGQDGKYVPAHAEIEGAKVIVWSELISKPASVRFAWNESAIPNFFNKEGLPAAPFRTDR